MNFNPDPIKQVEDILFSQKLCSPDEHPRINFNNIEVKKVFDHKHLGLDEDHKLSYKWKNRIVRKGIGIIKHLDPYLPLKSRDQILKMHIRRHQDYCDLICHIPAK